MPLYAQDTLIFVALDGLDSTVRGCCRDNEQLASIAYGLMVERVDIEFIFLIIYII